MNVLLLPYNIASDISHKVWALKSIGINARGLAFGSSAIQTTTAIEILADYSNNRFINRIRHLKNLKSIYQAVKWADIVHWTCFFGILPREFDKKIIKKFDKPGVIQWYGSDIRNPETDFAVNPFYKAAFAGEYEYKYESAENSLKNQRQFAEVGFYPLEFVGTAHYIDKNLFPVRFKTRQMIVLREHIPIYPDPKNDKPLIVHSPSAPFAKGTKYVLEAVENLSRKYDFEFVLVENMPRNDALEIMRRCDVYVDQLVLGAHGYAAIEAMAFGKPVICYINPFIGKDYPEALPIVSANPADIKEKLETLIRNPVLRHELGEKSRSYVEKYHDEKIIARELVETYETVIGLHKKSARKSDG